MRSLLAFLALAALAAPAGAQTSDETAVRDALAHYLLGHATGDGAHHSMVFHPESKLYFIRDGQFAQRTSAEYVAGSPGKPAADEANRRRRIVMVDVTGDAAVAKIELDYPDAFLTDYFTLLKVNGEWKIMNKIFTRAPARPAGMPTPAPGNTNILPAWLEGCWEQRAGERVTVEKWSEPMPAGAMFGSSRTVVNGTVRESEVIVLKQENSRLVYTARPSGQREASFTSTSVSDSGFTVTNPQHDFPQTIIYRRRGTDSLVARIEGPGRNGPRAVEYAMARVACT